MNTKIVGGLKKHKTLLISVLFLILFSITVSYANPPSSPYAGGQTLDPSCAPGDTNCTVTTAPAWSAITNTPTTLAGYGITDAYTKTVSDARYEVPLTFGSGLTRTTNTITNNFSTGVSGGQSVIGGTQTADVLSLLGTLANGTLTGPAIKLNVGNDGGTNAITVLNNGNVGIGTSSPSTFLNVQGTAEQLRLSYDNTHYTSFFSDAGNSLTISTVSPGQIIMNAVNLEMNGNVIYQSLQGGYQKNIEVYEPQDANGRSDPALEYGGSTESYYRIAFAGMGTANAMNTNSSYANVLVGSTHPAVISSATYPWLTNIAIKALGSISGSGATINNTASVYIDGASTAGSNNYALYVASGLSQFGSSAVSDGTVVATFQTGTHTCNIVPNVSGGITCSSDMNLKKNISVLADNSPWSFNANITPANQSVLAKVLALNPVDYNWNDEQDTSSKHAGFIAQEVQQVFPDLVSQDPKTKLLSLNYTGLVPYTVEAIKEMNVNITSIDDLTKANTWRDALLGWFGDRANGITDFFSANITSNKDTTKELCLNSTCLTETQLQNLIQLQQSMQQNNVTVQNTQITAPAAAIPDSTTASAAVASPDVSSDNSISTPNGSL